MELSNWKYTIKGHVFRVKDLLEYYTCEEWWTTDHES